MPLPSVRKLFRDHFSEESPIEIDPAQRAALIKEWRGKLERIEGVRLTNHPGDRDSRSPTWVRFTIPDPNESRTYYRSDELRLERSQQGELLFVFGRLNREVTALVSDFSELESFVAEVLRRYVKRRAGEAKREKVRSMKSKAIVARVKALAKEEQFDFATSMDTQKLKLFVKLSGQHMIEIHIPFTRFEKVLPQLQQTIRTLRSLYDDGLRFKMIGFMQADWRTEWIRHDE
nr:hypothetical protein [Rhodopirellula sp. JC740]